MFKKIIWFTTLYICTVLHSISAQQMVVNGDTNQKYTQFLDTINVNTIVKDTISPILLRVPDSLAQAKITDSISKGFGFVIFNLNTNIKNYLSKDNSVYAFQQGDKLPKGEFWVLLTILALVILFGVLKQTFSKQLLSIIQSFFNNRALSNLNKEDNVFATWPFLLLFVLFGFTIGLFAYLTLQFNQINQAQSGFNYYITISLLIIGIYGVKIIILKLLGFIFNIQKPISEYISILFLIYFNAALIFMPLVIAFALSPHKYGLIYIAIAIVLLSLIFVFQLARAGINILSNYRFSKVYLFLYFCTLEICPILILIKAIGF